jgi:hypothetical protein
MRTRSPAIARTALKGWTSSPRTSRGTSSKSSALETSSATKRSGSPRSISQRGAAPKSVSPSSGSSQRSSALPSSSASTRSRSSGTSTRSQRSGSPQGSRSTAGCPISRASRRRSCGSSDSRFASVGRNRGLHLSALRPRSGVEKTATHRRPRTSTRNAKPSLSVRSARLVAGRRSCVCFSLATALRQSTSLAWIVSTLAATQPRLARGMERVASRKRVTPGHRHGRSPLADEPAWLASGQRVRRVERIELEEQREEVFAGRRTAGRRAAAPRMDRVAEELDRGGVAEAVGPEHQGT